MGQYFDLYKLGYRKKDRLILLISIILAVSIYLILRISLRLIYGKTKRNRIFQRKDYSVLKWISNKRVFIIRDDVILSVYPNSEPYYFNLNYEIDEKRYVSSLDLRDVIVDVGANIGFYTIILAKHYPQARVIAIEASPTIFNRLQLHCAINKVTNVIALNKAISNKDNGMVEFYTSTSGNVGGSTMMAEYKQFKQNHDKSRFKTKLVETRTIDSLMNMMKIDGIDLLKIDIEGAESLALDGARNLLERKKIKHMLIEYHSLQNYRYVLSLLNKYGYTYVVHEKTHAENPEILGNFGGHIIARLSSNN